LISRKNSKSGLWSIIFIVLAFAALTVCQADETVIKSPNDDHQYEYLVLPNQLKVLIVSDPATDKAAASLDVNIGSASDPAEYQGLAHFLEHMLFLGTKKYPEAGEYKTFISTHGGSDNAYTALEHTNYFFDIDKDHLEPALDRFAQFFISPLFTAKYVDRERQIVHSEYQSKLKSDGWRIRSAQKHALNPKHPVAGFNVGSVETLADKPGKPARDELIRFYEQHYSANLMTLAVLGKEPLLPGRRHHGREQLRPPRHLLSSRRAKLAPCITM
jgi:secreted Zn-dependent insulinase-like peptidase